MHLARIPVNLMNFAFFKILGHQGGLFVIYGSYRPVIEGKVAEACYFGRYLLKRLTAKVLADRNMPYVCSFILFQPGTGLEDILKIPHRKLLISDP